MRLGRYGARARALGRIPRARVARETSRSFRRERKSSRTLLPLARGRGGGVRHVPVLRGRGLGLGVLLGLHLLGRLRLAHALGRGADERVEAGRHGECGKRLRRFAWNRDAPGRGGDARASGATRGRAMCSGARRDVAGRSRCGDGSDTGDGARVREWRPFVVNNNSRDAHDGPTHHYLTLLSTGHPAKEKCARLAKSISGPSSQLPIPGLFLCATVWEFHPFRSFNRARPVVLPQSDTLEQIFLERIVGNRKSTDFGGGRVWRLRTRNYAIRGLANETI